MLARSLINQLYGQLASIIVSQTRYRAVLIALPIVSLLPAYFALIYGLGREEFPLILAGAVISPSVWFSIGFMQDIVYEKVEYRYLEMLIASPMRPLIYAASRLLAGMLLAMASMLPMVALYVWLTKSLILIPLSVVLTLLLSMTLSPFSMVLGLRMANIKEVGSLPSLLSTFMVFLPPVYYTPNILPEWLRIPGVLMPSASAAEILRSLSMHGYEPIIDPNILLVYLIALAFSSTIILYFKFNWSLD